VLKIRLGIGGDEIANFFVTPGTPLFQPNLIFPNSVRIHCGGFAPMPVIWPISGKFGGAQATIASFTADDLFIGQSTQFFEVVNKLAEEANATSRQV
jgi:hypothetical protein